MSDAASAPDPPPDWRPAAQALFGERLVFARRFAELLVTRGTKQGLLGPREGQRIWERHLLNSAVLTEALLAEERVADVGSGAGLPGIPLALARPDLHLTLIEPMERRCVFLREVVSELALDERVVVVRGRAPECAKQLVPVTTVVARAVAPLDRLVSWTMPLCQPGGRLLALRGRTAELEIETMRADIGRAGGEGLSLTVLGRGLLPEPVNVVEVRRSTVQARNATGRRGDARHGGGSNRR